MATKKINLSGFSVEDIEVDGKEVILVSGTEDMTLTAAKKGSLTFTLGTGKNKATYQFEDHAVYNSGRTAVSLIGAADDFKATASSKNKNLATINASQVNYSIALTGNSKNNLIIAGDEDSTLNGGAGNDTLVGGEGEDIFVYKKNQGNDLIRGYNEEHVDQISLMGGATVTDAVSGKNYTVTFTVGKNKLTVEDAAYQEVTFISGSNMTTYKDGVLYSGDGLSVIVPASFSEKGTAYFDDTVVTIDASAAKKAVDLEGNAKANSIVGSTKNDTIAGYGGDDTINGGKGNDSLDGGAGADSLVGFDGNDYLYGDAGDDSLEGGKGNDTLEGGAGNDSLVGGDGNDSLEGGAGDDTLEGGKGNDKLYGGAGNDSLYGGAGNDSLWGDAGNDTFVYNYGDGKDVIYGFDNGDTLNVAGVNLGGIIESAKFSKKGDSVTLKIGSGSVTFKDFDTDTFHINDATYKVTEATNAKGKVTGYSFNEVK